MIFNTVDEMKLAILLKDQRVSTRGYESPDDGGAADYIIMEPDDYTGAPDGFGDHYIENGNIAKMLHDGVVKAKQFGAMGNSPDDSDQLASAFNEADTVILSSYHRVTKTLKVGKNKSVICEGVSVIDGANSEMLESTVMEAGSVVRNHLPILLSVAAEKGDTTLSFNGGHSLSVGDIICLYNPTDYSYSPARSYYRAGEFCKVATVISSTEIQLDGQLRDSYATSSVQIYKIDHSTFSVIGGTLDVRCTSHPTMAMTGLKLVQIADCDISGIKAEAKGGGYTALLLYRCINITGDGLLCSQSKPSGHNGDYGLVVANSQNINLSGIFSASRHGFTNGGFTDFCDVVCRDLVIRGIVKTTGEGDQFAFLWHGNIDGGLFEGICLGGYCFTGKNTKCRGEIHASDLGVAIYAAELLDYNHDMSGVTIHSDKQAPGNHSLIDVSADTVGETSIIKGGVLNFSNMNVIDQVNTRIFKIRTREENLTGGLYLDFSGTRIEANSPNTVVSIYVDSLTTKTIKQVNLQGLKINDNVLPPDIRNTDTTIGYQESVVVPVTMTTDVNHVEAVVTFPQPLPNLYGLPNNIVVSGTTMNGAVMASVYSRNASNTGITVGFATVDGSNFGSEMTANICVMTA